MHAIVVASKKGREENKPAFASSSSTLVKCISKASIEQTLSLLGWCCVCVRGATSVLFLTLDWNHVCLYYANF